MIVNPADGYVRALRRGRAQPVCQNVVEASVFFSMMAMGHWPESAVQAGACGLALPQGHHEFRRKMRRGMGWPLGAGRGASHRLTLPVRQPKIPKTDETAMCRTAQYPAILGIGPFDGGPDATPNADHNDPPADHSGPVHCPGSVHARQKPEARWPGRLPCSQPSGPRVKPARSPDAVAITRFRARVSNVPCFASRGALTQPIGDGNGP